VQTEKRVGDGVSLSLLESDMTGRDGDVAAPWVIPGSKIGDEYPADTWQTDIRPMGARAQNAGAAGIPTKVKQIVCEEGARLTASPGDLAPLVEAQGLPNVLVDLEFAKSGSFLWRTNSPGPEHRKIFFMSAIPAFDADFDGKKPREAK
jgi:hypothetical protein